jgi:transcriptional regulator with XRE-family HTH domain
MNVGERLAELRKDGGFKQKDIAKELNVAISTVSNYETNCHEPDLWSVCRLADLFGVTTDYLLGRTDLNLDLNTLRDPVDAKTTKADVLYMLDHLSKDDRTYLLKSIRLLYYQYRKPIPESSEVEEEMRTKKKKSRKTGAKKTGIEEKTEKKPTGSQVQK